MATVLKEAYTWEAHARASNFGLEMLRYFDIPAVWFIYVPKICSSRLLELPVSESTESGLLYGVEMAILPFHTYWREHKAATIPVTVSYFKKHLILYKPLITLTS